jgi:flagellar biosynthetic protein FlhB
MSDSEDKTEDPTPKKLEDARKKGDLALAPETKHAAMFVAGLAVMGGAGTYTIQRLGTLLVRLWGGADQYRMDPIGAQAFMTGVFGQIGYALAPILGMLFGLAVLGGLLQGRPTLSWNRVAPKFSKLNPVSGFKRMFGARAFVEFAKTLAKMTIVCGITASIVWPKAVGIAALVGADPLQIGAAASTLVHQMLQSVAMLVCALALFDIVWQRRSFMKRMRMSIQEIKDEHKESDGDPKIKAKIRQMQMQKAKRRMMAAVPTASVIVTNPTHYAVALKYDHGSMAAPVVVAKGVDALALKIREVAGKAGVPIVENRPLARALYASAEIDRPIPTEHYKAVAEVISYVLRLARQRRG